MNQVSIIMPCYNDGRYLEQAVASVRSQTYPAVELLVIDDGSDEPSTLAILEQLSQQGIRVLHSGHIGPSGARNMGIAAASGAYILPLDADDWMDETYVEKAAAVLDSQPQVGVVYCHADLFGESSGPWNLPEYSLSEMLVDNVVFVTAMFRKADWQQVGGFRTNMANGLEDYDFFLSLLELDRQIVQLPQTLFHYRIKQSSRTSRFVQDVSSIKETYATIYENHPALYEKYRHEYAAALRNALIDQTCKTMLLEKQLSGRLYGKAIALLRRFPRVKQFIKKLLIR